MKGSVAVVVLVSRLTLTDLSITSCSTSSFKLMVSILALALQLGQPLHLTHL